MSWDERPIDWRDNIALRVYEQIWRARYYTERELFDDFIDIGGES